MPSAHIHFWQLTVVTRALYCMKKEGSGKCEGFVCIHGTIFVELARLHSFWHLYGVNYVFEDEATSNDRFLRGL